MMQIVLQYDRYGIIPPQSDLWGGNNKNFAYFLAGTFLFQLGVSFMWQFLPFLGKKPLAKRRPLRWPQDAGAFISLPHVGNSQVRLTAVAICDEQGRARLEFKQGEQVQIFAEWEINDVSPSHVVGSGVFLHTCSGPVAVGKYQMNPEVELSPSQPGWRLRARYTLSLRLAAGLYRVGVGLAEVDAQAYADYRRGDLPYPEFAGKVHEILRADVVAMLEVKPSGSFLLNEGIADLVEDAAFAQKRSLASHRRTPKVISYAQKDTEDALPALIHVTHQKAGSQWVYAILKAAFPERIVPPAMCNKHFLETPVKQGKVYPTVYATKEEFDLGRLPEKWHRFVVVRDLRDTMISAYFSIRYSHPPIGAIPRWRALLNQMDQEEGLIWVLREWLPWAAKIQLSWWMAGERLIRYEDLLRDDVRIFRQLIVEEARWPIAPERLEEIVVAHRFENLTGGRRRGEENVKEHVRKGVAGDWRNYFTPRIKELFKAHYGGVLVALGYEKDLAW